MSHYCMCSNLSTAPLPPANLTVTQIGHRSLLVSWTPTGRPSHYTIYYQEPQSILRSVRAGPDNTSVILPSSFIFVGQNLSVSVMAETVLASEMVGPVTITIGKLVLGI